MDPVEKDVLGRISGQRLGADLDYLCDLDRTSGTPGENRAIDYVVEQWRAAGLAVRVHEFDAYLSYPREAGMEVCGAEPRSLRARTRAFSASTPPGGVEGDLVYVPGGTDMFRDHATLGRLEEACVRGKIVISEGGGRQNMIAAQRRGALGYVHIWPSPEDVIHEGIVTPVWGTPTPDTADSIPRIPVVSVTCDDGAGLVARLNRGERVTVRLHARTETGWVGLRLPEALIPGETDDFVLIGGHIDSWYLGATDNASGNAAMLELGRVLAGVGRMRRGVRIAMWPGHSTGRYAGSCWYADEFWRELHDHCVAYINVDSPGSQGATDYSLITAAAETSRLGVEVVGALTGGQVAWERPVRAGDQSFWGPGVSSLFMLLSSRPEGQRARVGGSGYGWWWHTPEDTRDKVDEGILAQDTGIYALATLRLCRRPVPPLEVGAAARELSDVLDGIQDACGPRFDLGPARDAAGELAAVAARFDEACSRLGRGEDVPGADLESVNRALVRSLHLLTTVNYTVTGPFDHDPAVPQRPVPSLQPARDLVRMKPGTDESGFLLTRLRRSRNRLEALIREAVRTLAGAVPPARD